MLSLDSNSDTQDYTYDPNLLQESLAGIYPQFMLPSYTCVVDLIAKYIFQTND